MTGEVYIPLDAVSAQTLQSNLAGQDCTISVYTRWNGTYLDLSIGGVKVASSRLCVNGVPITRVPYAGLTGDFYFIDTQGNDNPYYTGFGTRWFLVYA